MHIEHGDSLLFGQIEALFELFFLLGVIGGGEDDVDDLADIVDRDQKPLQDMLALFGGGEIVLRALIDDLALIFRIIGDDVQKPQLLRSAVRDGDHVDRHRGLQLGLDKELLQYLLGVGVAAQPDDRAYAAAVGLVDNLGDVAEIVPVLFFERHDRAQNFALLHLEGELGHHDALLVSVLFDKGVRAHDQPALARLVSLPYPLVFDDKAAGGEIGRGEQLHYLVELDTLVLDISHDRVDGLAQIMRRYLGRKSHGDAARAVDEQVGKAPGEHVRLFQGVVEVERHGDGILAKVAQKLHRERSQARLGISHRRRAVAVGRAEVAVTVDERRGHGKGLGELYHRSVNGRIAMGMIFSQAFAHDTRGLLMRLVGGYAKVEHAV